MFGKSCNTIPIDIIHLSDSPIKSSNHCNSNRSDRNKWKIQVGNRLKTTLKRLTNISAISLQLVNLQNNTSDENYYEDENVCKYSGQIECKRNDRIYVKKVITSICTDHSLSNTWFSLSDHTLQWISKSEKLVNNQSFGLSSFKFGTLVHLTQFIKHYDSNDANYYNSKLYVTKGDTLAQFQHYRKLLNLKFRLTNGTNRRFPVSLRYKLEYDYLSFDSIVIYSESDNIKLYINLNHPPILYICENDIRPCKQPPNKRNKYPKPNQRNIFNSSFNSMYTDETSSLINWIRENQFNGLSPETLGKCNVLVIDIPMIKNHQCLLDSYSLVYTIKQLVKIPIYFANISEHNCVNNSEYNYLIHSNNISIPFSVSYAYHSVFSHTFQASDELFFKFEFAKFMEKVEEFAEVDPQAIEETLFQITTIIESRSIFRALNALEKIFFRLKKKNQQLKYQEAGVKSFRTEIQDIRRCILTPTRLLLLPPQPILKSRFVVNSEPDYTLRLTIREDNLLGLSFKVGRSGSRTNQINFVKKIVKNPLINGLRIGDRIFEFLGSSSSQLRDSGMILYAKDSRGRTAESIRESVGDMSPIRRSVPKYVARLGLVFSQAMTHVNISEETKIDVFPDIEGVHKPDFRNPRLLTKERYVFSDGIGMVSEEIAKKVYKQLPNECVHKPSAMQIRFGGCKGMLVINPKLKGEHIVFRNSMKKYESNDRALGILKLSAPRPVYLNRPLISILEQLKVKPRVFLGMLMENLNSLANSLVCECSALTLLQNANSLCIPYEKLLASGLPFLSEPIFQQVVDCLITHRIKELKSKARIKVPMSCGRIAFGVLDETGSLAYGQIFAKLSHVNKDGSCSDKCFILEGKVMVTKFPCLHPGDVRKLTAVNIPALNHIKDCIVFPARGPRPHPDEMAGSDLDGDEYALFWNCDLLFEGQNIPAMHFPTGNARELDHNAQVEDILDFYCDYILSNNVGLLANAHLANADFCKNGIFDKICTNLAAKYAISLDFAKTGIIEPIDREERPKLYPDFMEKCSEKRTYLSRNILGQLYRQCCTFEMAIQSRTELKISAQPNPKLVLKGWQKYEVSATNAFILYKERISYLLNRFGVASEAALLSGAFSKINKYTTGRTEFNDAHELLESLVKEVFVDLNLRFKNECKNCSVKDKNLRASAWYMISYKFNHMSQNYFGFPWTIADHLCNLIDKPISISVRSQPHDCVRNSARALDHYLQQEGLHKDPEIDVNDSLVESRVKIIEMRVDSAEFVLKNWLERQQYLFFKRNNETILWKNDEPMSDIYSKLRLRLTYLKLNVMNGVKDIKHPIKVLRTTGNLVMNFMKDLVNEWLSLDSFLQNNNIFDTPLVKFGFSALLALNRFFRTQQISHIIDFESNSEVAVQAPIETDTFYFVVPQSKNSKQFIDYMIRDWDEFCEELRKISGVIEVQIQLNDLPYAKFRNCYQLSASGTTWSLQTLRNVISHPTFFDHIPNKNWLERDCRGV